MPSTSHVITLTGEDGQTPLIVTATVVAIDRRAEPTLFGVCVGLEAQLAVTVAPHAQPHTYFLSRLVGETTWIVDALFGPNGYPHFSHGFGARYLRLRTIAPELAEVVDQEARSRGLVEAAGRDSR